MRIAGKGRTRITGRRNAGRDGSHKTAAAVAGGIDQNLMTAVLNIQIGKEDGLLAKRPGAANTKAVYAQQRFANA